MTINITQLSNEIARELVRYSRLVTDEMEVSKKEVAKELVSELKKTSPKRTGDYAASWKTRKEKTLYRVYVDDPEYRLTHLLEYGHAKRDGGRVAAKVHIRPAEEQAIKDYVERVEAAIKS